jgi:hypothetical protein
MNETTPTEITPHIRSAFLSHAGNPPQYIPVRPAPHARVLECFLNIARHAERHGGQAVSGWMAWTDPHARYLYLVAHSVWQTPGGDLLDITPQRDGETSVLFAPDPRVVYWGRPIPGRYVPLVDDPAVHEQCRRLQTFHQWSVELAAALLGQRLKGESNPRPNARERAKQRKLDQRRKR